MLFISRWLRAFREKTTSPGLTPAQPAAPQLTLQPQPPFLELNDDVLIAIISILPCADRLAVALACKPLFYICNNVSHQLSLSTSRDDKEDFLLRLERDLMASHHYCGICMKLHRTSSLTKPAEHPGVFFFYGGAPPCLDIEYEFSPPFARNYFAYHHGRGAMNRHFYGAPAGLDPDSLCYETLYRHPFGQRVQWSGRYSVRIRCNSLFLFAKHTMDSADEPSITPRIEETDYHICQHTPTSVQLYYQSLARTAAGLDASDISMFLRDPGRVVHGSCARCLTDYTVEVTRNCWGSGKAVFYRVKIVAISDLGQFRSPEEWKWKAWRFKISENFTNEPRDFQLYPPGSVRQRYYAAEGKAI